MASLSIRIDLDGGGRIGPGKVRLLEAVAQAGSISAAAAALGMSYRRAWTLVAELNGLFRTPVVEASPGGRKGGGASLTPLGRRLVDAYRAVEAGAGGAAADALSALEAERRPPA